MTLAELKSQMGMLRNQRAQVQVRIGEAGVERATMYRKLMAMDTNIAGLHEIAAGLFEQLVETNQKIVEIESAQPTIDKPTTKFDKCSYAYQRFIRTIVELGEKGFHPTNAAMLDRCETMREQGALRLVKRIGEPSTYYVDPEYLPPGVAPINPVGMPAPPSPPAPPPTRTVHHV